MKKLFNYITLFAALSATLLTGCKKQDLVFDHEKQQFETKADAILLEVIVPSGTATDEEIYITGEFNGGDKYLLEKAENSDKKWGIYLYAEDFADGKSLKDGFTFVSAKNGKAFDVKGNPQTWTLDVAYGSFTNVWVSRWESYFKQEEDPGEIVPGEYEHLYIIGNVEGAGWKPAEQLEFTMVGTDIFRGEFTFVPDGSNAVCYFAITTVMGADNDDWGTVNAARWGNDNTELTEGNVVDLKLQDGSDQNVTIAPGTYTITVNMVTKQIVIGNGDWDKPEKPSKYEHLYILGNVEGTGWTPAEPLELKKVGRDLFRGEFTFVPDGTNTTCWFAFATEKGASNDDWATLNAARWGGGELTEGVYLPLTLQTTSDMTVTIAPGTYTITVNMIFKEAVIGEGDWSDREEPEDEPVDEPVEKEQAHITIYLYDATESMNALLDTVANVPVEVEKNMYVWGSTEIFGGWPGAALSTFESTSMLGLDLLKYEFDCNVGDSFNFILNNKGANPENVVEGSQYDAFGITADESKTLYYKLTDTGATALQVQALAPARK